VNQEQEIVRQRAEATLRRMLGPSCLKLQGAIDDPAVTEIIVNPDGAVWLEAHGRGLYEAGFTVESSQVETLIGQVAAALGTVADARHPIVEGELPLGRIRFEGLMPPISPAPSFVMRKPAAVLYTLADYVRDGILPARYAEVFREAVNRKLNIVIAGGTGSGKTTLAGALVNEMVEGGDPAQRFVLIEDTYEIHCRAKNLQSLRTNDENDMTRLVRATMRLRPDRIIVGETRGAEALALLKAWLTGHPGGVTTVHANSARAALTRLSSLVQEAGVPPQPELIAETINLIAYIERTSAGRKVTEVVRVTGWDSHRGFNVEDVQSQGRRTVELFHSNGHGLNGKENRI
jgi:type IV secretion system protein TrbB